MECCFLENYASLPVFEWLTRTVYRSKSLYTEIFIRIQERFDFVPTKRKYEKNSLERLGNNWSVFVESCEKSRISVVSLSYR